MRRIFLHLKRYGSLYYFMITAVCISVLFLCMFFPLGGHKILEIGLIIFEFSVLVSISAFLFKTLLEKEREMAKYLQSKVSSLANRSIDEIQDSFDELDRKDYIALRKEYIAYKKEQKRLEKIEIKRLAKLREQERNQELELEKQKIVGIKNLILKNVNHTYL